MHNVKPETPSFVLHSILSRFTDSPPARGGYSQFLLGKDTEPVARSMVQQGHILRHPMLQRLLDEWGIVPLDTEAQ